MAKQGHLSVMAQKGLKIFDLKNKFTLVVAVVLTATTSVNFLSANSEPKVPECRQVFEFVGYSLARSASNSSIEHARRKACLNAFLAAIKYFDYYSFCMAKESSLKIELKYFDRKVNVLKGNSVECVLEGDRNIYSINY